MTTGSDKLPPALRRWAAEQIGIDESASIEQIQAAFFTRLRETNFSPPLAWSCALALLQRGLPEVWRAEHEPARSYWEQLLRGEVEAFAACFFSLDLEARRRRWSKLLAECKPFLPRLAARLQALEPGLQIDATAVPRAGSPVGDLARDVMRLFVLGHAERTAARQALIVEQQREASRWHEAACSLGFRYPRLAALDPALVDFWKQSEQREGRRDELHRRLRNRRQPVVTSSRGTQDNSGRLVFVGAIILMIVFRIIAMLGDAKTSPPRTVPPSRRVVPNRMSNREAREVLQRLKEVNTNSGDENR